MERGAMGFGEADVGATRASRRGEKRSRGHDGAEEQEEEPHAVHIVGK